MKKNTSTKHIEANALAKHQFINPITIEKEYPLFKSYIEQQKFFNARIFYDLKQCIISVLNTENFYNYIYAPETFKTENPVRMVKEPTEENNRYFFNFVPADFFNITLGKNRTTECTESLKRRIIEFESVGAKPIPMYSENGKKIVIGTPYTIELDFDNKHYTEADTKKMMSKLKQYENDKTKIMEDAMWKRLTRITISVHKNLVECGLMPYIKEQKKIRKGFFQNLPSNHYIKQREFLENHFKAIYDDMKERFEEGIREHNASEEILVTLDFWYKQIKEKTIPYMQIAIESCREFLNVHDTRPDINKDSVEFDFENFIANTFFQYSSVTKSNNYSHRKSHEDKILSCIELFILEELTNAVDGQRNGADCIPIDYIVTRGGTYNTIKTISFSIIRPDTKNNFIKNPDSYKILKELKNSFKEKHFKIMRFFDLDNFIPEPVPSIKVTKKQQVFDYLNRNPNATASDIKRDLNINSNSFYHYLKLWKNEKTKEKEL